jgi:signal peptidase I
MRRISEFNYNGPSMSPVMKPGDGIVVDKSVKIKDFRVGDIICYRPEGYEYYIVHRIVEIKKDGVITRGDNNSDKDPYLINVDFDPLFVSGIRRGNKTIKVYGGFPGYLNHKKNLIFKFLRVHIKSYIKRILDRIAESEILYFINPFHSKIKVLNYKMELQEYQIMLVGKKQIGRKNKGQSWNIRHPWKLFINPLDYDKKNEIL